MSGEPRIELSREGQITPTRGRMFHVMFLSVGSLSPDFSLANQFGETVTLNQFRGVKPVVLVFFPLAFSGTCTGELCELRDNLAMFAAEGVELMAISVDSKSSLRAWAEHEGYDFTLLADFWPHGEVARKYGIFHEERGFANRATFLIDTDGVIRARFLAAPGEARSLQEYTAALSELRLGRP
jgi:peroxiredoxin